MLRSTDNCATWEDPVVVSFRPTSRDGMPVPLCLQNGKSLVFAIEDNGLNGNFKPVIIHSSVADSWRSGTVTGSSPHRWSALASTEELDAPKKRESVIREKIKKRIARAKNRERRIKKRIGNEKNRDRRIREKIKKRIG